MDVLAKRQKFLLVDGNSLVYRGFYALPPLTTQQGEFTNAAFGFTTMLLKALEKLKPDYIAVAFDKAKITFRHARYKDYKGTRKSTPEELRPQFDIVKNILRAMRIAFYELEGYEADDIIGTMAKKAEAAGMQVEILTSDRDALQLISEHISLLLTKKGISELTEIDLVSFTLEYGLAPGQMVDVKALMGDKSDNIPGVPGIGEKTAVKLIKEFGGLGQLLENLPGISTPKLVEKLTANAGQALMSKELATIDCSCPVEFCSDECLLQDPDYEALLRIFEKLEFRSLTRGILQTVAQVTPLERGKPAAASADTSWTVLETGELIERLTDLGSTELGVCFVPDRDGKLGALGLAWEDETVAVKIPGENQAEEIQRIFLLLEADTRVYFYDAKVFITWGKSRGLNLPEPAGDVMLAAYLLDPSAGKRDLAEIVLKYLDQTMAATGDLLETSARQARAILEVHSCLEEELMQLEMLELYRELELPLERVLTEMEMAGIRVDFAQLEQMGRQLAEGITALTSEIYLLAGEEFNINSPRQLGSILFDKLGLPPLKKTKTGYSTNAEVLEALAAQHDIVTRILEYRQLVKLKTTYVDGLYPLVDKDTGKLHTTFNQTVTATGRLSSTEPNLQNIPIRLELGRQIRKVFIPENESQLLLAADYSQIELRVLAHLSGDQGLTTAFLEDADIHTRTAAEVFGVNPENVTLDMRRRAKAVNFGIVYGISDYGLSRDLGISRQEAKSYIEQYFERYPGVRRYIEACVQGAREQGYITTMLKRRRYLPDVFSSNHNVRNFGERTAMNTPIQGSAADIIKLAMLRIFRRSLKEGLSARMLLQVHDELIFQVEKERLAALALLVRQEMESACQLDVPLKVDVKVGSNWYELKPYGGDQDA